MYHAVVRKTSPWSVLAMFWSEDAANDWIAHQAHPDQFTVITV